MGFDNFRKACGRPKGCEYHKGVKRKDAKEGRAVYALIKDGEIIYIGMTWNLYQRLAGHKSKGYDYFIYYLFKSVWKASGAEYEAIGRYLPIYNTHGNWRNGINRKKAYGVKAGDPILYKDHS